MYTIFLDKFTKKLFPFITNGKLLNMDESNCAGMYSPKFTNDGFSSNSGVPLKLYIG